MKITKIKGQNFRNLTNFSVEPSSKINVLLGDNGSGKTSFLESIYLLFVGRSFRTSQKQFIIKKGENFFDVQVCLENSQKRTIEVEIRKNNKENSLIKVNQSSVSGVAEVAKMLPIQLIHSEGFKFLTEKPLFRRQFLDWGVFHVEPHFFQIWKNVQRCLKQRNLLLQENKEISLIKSWDKELVKNSEMLESYRKAYIEKFKVCFKKVWENFSFDFEISIDYRTGWDETKSYEEILEESLHRDIELGYTVHGPQRSDMKIYSENMQAKNFLSRGQLKIVFCVCQFVHGLLLKEETNKNTLYLIDDIMAELDKKHFNIIYQAIQELDTQIFLTGIDKELFSNLLLNSESKMFHVKHDTIEEAKQQ